MMPYTSLNKIEAIKKRIDRLCDQYNIPASSRKHIYFTEGAGDNTYCVVGNIKANDTSEQVFRFTFNKDTLLVGVDKFDGKNWDSVFGFESVDIFIDPSLQIEEGKVFHYRYYHDNGDEYDEYLYPYRITKLDGENKNIIADCYIIPKEQILLLLQEFMQSKGFSS